MTSPLPPLLSPLRRGIKKDPLIKGQVSFPLWGGAAGAHSMQPPNHSTVSWHPSSTTGRPSPHIVRSPPCRGQREPGQRDRAGALAGKQDLPSVPNPAGHCCPPGGPQRREPQPGRKQAARPGPSLLKSPSGPMVIQGPLGGTVPPTPSQLSALQSRLSELR